METVYAAFGIQTGVYAELEWRPRISRLGLKTLLGGNSCEEVGGESVTIIKRCSLLIRLLTVPDTNNLIVNI